MSTGVNDTVLSRVQAFRDALDAAPANDAIERARYQAERLEHALRSSHSEGIRFAAYTADHLLATRADRFPAAALQAFAELKGALEAAGHHF